MGINFRGDHGFESVGTPRWIPNGWELDRLIVPMKGAYSKLNAYLASLTMWAPSTIDSNMFLSDFPVDGDPIWPTVDLTYIGKRNGKLPPDKHSNGQTIQQASSPVLYEVTYVGPTTTLVRFSRNAIDTAVVGPPAPPNAKGIFVNVVGAIPVFDDAAIATIISNSFKQRAVTTGNSEELVPGEYYRGEITKTNLFFHAGTA